MASKKEKLKFFKVNSRYIEYLKEFDPCVPDIIYENRNRFFVGVMFTSHDAFFIAPVSSNKHYDYFNANYPLHASGKLVGNIRLNYMIPVPIEEIELMNFDADNKKYQMLVRNELIYCQRNQDKIVQKAHDVYTRVISNEEKRLENHCCDFEKLENKCVLWEQTIEQKADEFMFRFPSIFSLCNEYEIKKMIRGLNENELGLIDRCVEGWSLDGSNPYFPPKIDNVYLEYAVDSWIHGELKTEEFIPFVKNIRDVETEIIFEIDMESELQMM